MASGSWLIVSQWRLKMNRTRTNFEKLSVYRLAEKLADEIWTIVVS